jgi:hypothetical protein
MLSGGFVDRAAGLIAAPVAAVFGIMPLLHRIFIVASATSALARADIQRREASTPNDRLTMNQTPLVHSTQDTQIERGMGKHVCSADTAPLTSNDQS